MSKRELKKYVKELTKEQLEEQIVELYTKFKDVKVYYDFAFNPNEDKLIDECKVKISKEYFPIRGRRAKMRRSVAQKAIKHFITIGVESHLIADIMLYNIEIAQTYRGQNRWVPETFYGSMLKSFREATTFIASNGIKENFLVRVDRINNLCSEQSWPNRYDFDDITSDFRDIN
ncbi:MAG: DUF6155 family protein [Bacteroidales bacterium]|jgi:hypothetical protein|nr:DUF6155 family protein [Bacteroidales bacterium]